MAAAGREAFVSFLDLLFPPKCPFCQKVQNAPGICPACRQSLPWAEPLVKEGAGFGRCAAPLRYEGSVREAILRFKFNGKISGAELFGDFLASAAAEAFAGEFDCVTWVPVSRRRLRKRGFDQAQMLAEAASAHWEEKPLRLLRKVQDNPAQSGQSSASARRANVLGVYEPLPEARGRRILLIDDVITTGSTLAECVKVLRLAGAEQVVCAAVAQTTFANNAQNRT
ncbi:ComF family protein [Oscillibacter hominis]|uniref:ComF family protein n=1 Tax=Oscillibacter hominis TaxID=2763056 RepID=A0A7G9B4G2_9FIRM|nr:ComF family protein [Oscillibacter hominis]